MHSLNSAYCAKIFLSFKGVKIMKKTKRISALILAALICITAAACGSETTSGADGTKKPSKGDKGESVAVDAEMEYFENVPAKLDGTTVKFATWIDHTRNESAEVLSDFTNLTGIKVEIVTIAQTDYVTRLSSLIAAGESPDVIVNNGEFPTVLPLAKPLNETILDTTDEFWNQDVVKLYTIDNKPYFVNVKGGAWDMGGSCVVYNLRMFEDNGITTPATYYQEGRWTLDNFYKAARELKAVNSAGGVGIDLNGYLANYFATAFVEYDPIAAKINSNIDKPEFIKALQELYKARDNGYALVNEEASRWMFENESIGMIMVGTYGLRKTGWFNGMDIDDIAFAPLPTYDANSEQPYGATGGRSYGICKGAKNADGAAYFLRYFLNMDFYDKDEVFKNDECAEFAADIQKNATVMINPTYTVARIFGSTEGLYGIFPDLKECTSDQVPTALKSGANSLNACIDKANQIIENVKKGQ